MSANFALASADVVKYDTEGEAISGAAMEGVQVTVRNGKVITQTDRGEHIETLDNVLLSVRINRLEWRVTFKDHTVWHVSRSKKGCRRCG